MNIKNKKILLTGGNSFLGKSLVPLLNKKGAKTITFSSKEYDLTKENQVKKLFEKYNPNIVIHLAVDCGGFKYKKENKASMFYNNLMMDTLVQEYSRLKNADKFIGVGSAASYSEFVNSPIKETEIFCGLPEEFNISYGLTKRMMVIQSKNCREQYGFNSINLIPVNLYGPNFSLKQKDVRIIPIFIKEFVEAKIKNKESITLNGTPEAYREFLYVGDCVEAIILATELYNKSNPVNLGSGKAIKIKDLAEKVKEATGFKGKIIWNENSNENQPEKVLDVSMAEKEFRFKEKTSLEEGLKKTVEWYRKNYGKLK